MLYSYSVHEAAEFINWLYFFHSWGFGARFARIAEVHACPSCRRSWVGSFASEERAKAEEAVKLYDDARFLLNRLDEENVRIEGLTELFPANSDGDDLIFYLSCGGDGTECGECLHFPLLRQQKSSAGADVCLCLSDFVRPASSGIHDRVGVFATAVHAEKSLNNACDVYYHLIVQTLCDRLAEAGAEMMHAEVRKKQWGYAPDEHLDLRALHAERYQGIRPAVGYPSLPDQSVAFLVDQLVQLKRIGIRLTETGAMHPSAATCGLMLAHPAAHYFSVGKISAEQLHDYAVRRGWDELKLRSFLAGNL